MACVKTAISIEEALFRKAERLAGKLKISRSQLFARAMREFLSRYTAEEIKEKINEVYAGPPDEEAKRLLAAAKAYHAERVEGTW